MGKKFAIATFCGNGGGEATGLKVITGKRGKQGHCWKKVRDG